jgi:hypothetical protein
VTADNNGHTDSPLPPRVLYALYAVFAITLVAVFAIVAAYI